MSEIIGNIFAFICVIAVLWPVDAKTLMSIDRLFSNNPEIYDELEKRL